MRFIGWVLVFAVFVRLAPVSAQSGDATTPWSRGVTAEQKARAQALLEKGNQLFLDKKYTEAVATYGEALEAWDHPAIRFNLVRAYIQLDRPVDAFDNLELSLRYGEAPFESEVFAEAQSYLRLLRGQIAEVKVSCEQAGVKVSLDGAAFLTCPGTKTARVKPGEHQVVGELAGYLTKTEVVQPLADRPASVELELVSIADAAVTKRRWAAWKPWAVVGGGAVVAGVGGLLTWYTLSSDEDNAASCTPPSCSGAAADDYRDTRDRDGLLNGIGRSMIIAGGATVVTGAVLVYMNRLRPIALEQEQPPMVGVFAGDDSFGATFHRRF